MSQVTTLDQAIETAPADLDASSTATSASQHVAPGVPR